MLALISQVNLKDTLFGTNPVKDVADSPTSLLTQILPNVFVAAGLILLLILLFGGFTLVTSAGDPEKTQQGQKAITNAIIGFLIILASYWIIQIIQVITGIPIFNANI